ncbi:MAG: hypothetical protein HQK53_15030 [Oligoflexia bacterium]|nr:hypothetical protein [Oligoflexia bacterium]
MDKFRFLKEILVVMFLSYSCITIDVYSAAASGGGGAIYIIRPRSFSTPVNHSVQSQNPFESTMESFRLHLEYIEVCIYKRKCNIEDFRTVIDLKRALCTRNTGFDAKCFSSSLSETATYLISKDLLAAIIYSDAIKAVIESSNMEYGKIVAVEAFGIDFFTVHTRFSSLERAVEKAIHMDFRGAKTLNDTKRAFKSNEKFLKQRYMALNNKPEILKILVTHLERVCREAVTRVLGGRSDDDTGIQFGMDGIDESNYAFCSWS